MKKIFIIAFIFSASVAHAQKPMDSLLSELRNYTAQDTVRATLLNTISRKYAGEGEPQSGLLYADSSIALCIKINSDIKLSTAYFAKASNLVAAGDNKAAIEYYKKSYLLNVKLGREMGSGTVMQNMGISYYNISEFYKAQECHEQALKIFKKLNYANGEAAALNSLGIIYRDLSDYPKALEYYFESLKICEMQEDTFTIATAYSNIGLVYARTNEKQKALHFQQKALVLYKNFDDKIAMARCYNNLGTAYSELNNGKMAFENYALALDIYKQEENKFGIASIMANMGIDYSTFGNYALALEHLQKAVPLFIELGDRDNEALMYNEIGTVFFKAPEIVLINQKINPRERLINAIEIKNRALQIYNEVGDLAGAGDVHESLSEIYNVQGDFKNAFQTYKQFILVRDSIINDQKKVEVARREMQYDFDKKQSLAKLEHKNEIALSNAELSRERIIKNSAMGGAAVLVLAGASSFVFYKRRRDAEKQKTESDFKVQVSDTEMKALRAQMNPHFIFNSLNSITDYIDKHDSNTATLFTTKFAKLMRIILENSEKKEVALADDLKALELYMQLESLRMNNKFTYHIHVDESIDKETTLVPPLILQPFIENSIWHGISRMKGTGKINISIKKDSGMIKCIVEDNGVGRKIAQQDENNSLTEKKSLGMKITKSRIDIINKIKKSRAGVELFDSSEGMRVEIMLPLELSF